METIYVKPGETLTVFLVPSNTECWQVELRVRPDGTPELFSQLPAKGFEEWYSTEEEDDES